MPVFNFPQLEHEPFWSYLSRLNVYRAQLNQTFEKWKFCEVIVLGLNTEFRGVVESIYPGGVLGLLSKTQDEVWNFFEKLAWDTYEFEQAKNNFGYPLHSESVIPVSPYPQDHFINSHDPSYSCVPPVWCDYCESSAHDACSCLYRDYFDAQCASVEQRLNALTHKVLETMKKRITEHSHCFNQSMERCDESDSSLGSPKPAVSLFDDFEPSYRSRPHLHDDLSLPSLEKENNLPVSLSSDLAPHTSSHTDVINNVLVSTSPPTIFDDSSESEGQEPEKPDELDMSIPSVVEHHNKLDDIVVQESCEEEVEPTILEFNDDILSVEYESFSCGFNFDDNFDEDFCVEYELFSFNPPISHKSFSVEYDSFTFDVDVGLDVDLCVEYESFSFDPIRPDFLFESCESDFVESANVAPENFALEQTPIHIDLKGLVDLGPTDLPRPIIHDDYVSRPITHFLATFESVCLFSDWAQQFDQLRRALTCAELQWWMYSLWHQLFNFCCQNFIKSCSCLYDKLLRALMGFDLHSSLFICDGVADAPSSSSERGYSLGVIQHLTWYTRSFLSLLFILFVYISCFDLFL